MKDSGGALKHLSYVPALDGLRAIAVMLVFSLHLDVPEFPGGNLGVDIFFALSGYLITSLLLREFDVTGSISLKRFYIRRILRLFPALLFILAVYSAGTMIFYPNWHDHLVAVLSALFYVSNWMIAFNWGPFGLMGLMHTWSLAVEEQFYLIWPPLLVLGLRTLRFSRLLVLTALTACLSIAWRLYLQSKGASVDRLYCGFDTRLDCLAVGCIAALIMSRGLVPKRATDILALNWLQALILTSFILFAAIFHSESPFMLGIGHTLVAAATCCLICGLLNGEDSPVNRFLSLPPMVFVGKLSYAIYLWHHPVLILLRSRAHLGGWKLFIAAVVITGAASVFSYYFVELRFLRLKEKFTFTEKQ